MQNMHLYIHLTNLLLKTKLGIDYQDGGFVCSWEDGRPLRPGYVTTEYKKVIMKSGFRFVNFKDLRASVATVLHHGGNAIKNVQNFLGHADIATTMDIYTHINEHDLGKLADTMDKVHGAKL